MRFVVLDARGDVLFAVYQPIEAPDGRGNRVVARLMMSPDMMMSPDTLPADAAATKPVDVPPANLPAETLRGLGEQFFAWADARSVVEAGAALRPEGMTTAALPLVGNLIKGRVYALHCRNLICGVWDGARGFIGIREKFGSRYLFTEYHWDVDPHHGTVQTAVDFKVDVPLGVAVNGDGHNDEMFGFLDELLKTRSQEMEDMVDRAEGRPVRQRSWTL